jgi:hypothetical protein
MDLIEQIAKAIATMEGFFKANTIAQRNNNPGNLRSWGSAPVVNGYAKFATAEEGWAALRAQIKKNIGRGLTLEEFFTGKPGVYPGYAPAADKNDPGHYARVVAGRVGIPVDQPIGGFTGGAPLPGQPAPGQPVFAKKNDEFPAWLDPGFAPEGDGRLLVVGAGLLGLAALLLV